MKIYISHSNSFNFKKELYQPIRSSVLNETNEIILPHEIYQSATDFITKNIIRESNIMIAEVSYPSTGSGIEIGWANAFGIPIICMYKEGKEMSGSLKVVTDNFIEYSDTKDMIEKINNIIEDRSEEVKKDLEE